MDELEAKVSALDVKDKIVFVTNVDTELIGHGDIKHLQDIIVRHGGYGLVMMANADITTKTLDDLIGHLQKLKKEMSN